MESHQSQQQRGTRRGPGRPRGSSRAGRHSSSPGHRHAHNSSPVSLTNIINFGDEPSSINACSPASSRGRVRGSNHHDPSHHFLSSPISADFPEPASDAMGLDDHRAAPRPDRVPKQPLNHSFTFSTPENPRHEPGRKRARTLEYPADAAAAAAAAHHDDAKVKGGHSLRKRVRIDYAQMNDDNEEDHANKDLQDDRTEITVSGARGVRKRRSTADPHNDEDPPPQPPLATVTTTKRARSEKQRTVSPKPQRRRTQQRKSISAPVVRPAESPDQQPSDTELKDTIEVGAPLALQFTGSSSSQPSETASNISGQSPSQTRHAQPSIFTGAQVASPTAIGQENEPSTSFVEKDEESPLSVLDGTEQSQPEDSAIPAFDEPSQEDVGVVAGKEEKEASEEPAPAPAPPDLGQQLTSALSAVPEVDDARFATQSSQDPESGPFETEMPATSFQDQSQGLKVPSSQESIDSDATQDMPPDGPLGNSALARELRNTISSVVDEQPNEQPTEQPTKISEIDDQKEPAAESLQNDQETEVSLPRTRRRLGRLVGNSSATEEDSSQLPTQTERRSSASRKSEKAKSDVNSAVPSVPTPESPETPKRRKPGRPPKIRQSIEQEPREPRVPRKRRAAATTQTIAQPRPMRAHTPRDFSFLTPYTDAQDAYPEIAQDYGVPTPGDTPNLQNSEDPGEPPDDESLAPDRDSGSQEQGQSRLEGGSGSNAPTPAPMSEMPTPAAESMPASRNASPEPVVESIRKGKSRKQFRFTRIRSPTDFVNVLDDHKNMSTEDLFNALEASANALGAWQDEWKKRKLVTEDEDNAVRRRAHDAALMAREARDMAKTNGAISVEKRDFEIKGIRASLMEENKLKYPESNPEVYERNQDQVAAQAYGFEWDPRPSMIGRQDPIGQRDGLQNNRLRNRPKLSQRAAEAAVDDPVGIVTGKRTRKPRILSDDSKDVSRAPTPLEPVKPKQRGRRRKNAGAENLDSDYEAPAAAEDNTPTQKAEAPEAPPPDQPVKKRRGPKPGAKAAREAAARAAAEKEAAEKAEQEALANAEAARDHELYGVPDEQPQTRKRRRGAAATDTPASSFDGAHQQPPPNESVSLQGGDTALPAPKRQRGRKSAAATQVEIPPGTFYSAGSSVPTNDDTVTPTEDFRPSTSSSTSSMHTVGSSYSFRHRPRKNYSELADPIKDKLAEPRPKRGRRAKKDQQEPEPTSAPSNFMPAQLDGSSYGPPGHGYMHHQSAPVLAPPNNPFINVTGGGPGQLLAPAPVRLGPAPAPPPHPVGAQNPFSAPHTNAPVEHPPHIEPPQSPRKKQPRIKIINRSRQNATPQPNGPPPPHQSYSHSGHQAPPLAPLQPPPSFHGQTGYEQQFYGGGALQPHSMPGAGPGQFSFPVNSSPHTAMSMPPMMPNGPPFPPMGSLPGGPGSLPSTNSRGNSKPPGSGRATPAPSSAEGEDLSEKDYASMTKSEKMSASMKARWANGSMRQAVNKRKETLARKKQKQSDEKNPTKTSTPTPQPEMPPSQSRTPVTATAPNFQAPAAGGGAAQPSPADMAKNLPPAPERPTGGFGGILMGGDYGGPPPLPGGMRAPSQAPMQHDDRQMLGYMHDGPPAHMPLPGGIWEAHARPSYPNGSGREELNGDRHVGSGGAQPAPGWGPQN